MNVKFEQFPSNVAEIMSSVNGAKMALNRLERGSEDTPRSWFYENLSPDDVIAPVVKRLNEMQDLTEIAEWDLGKLPKYAPQGASAPFSDRLTSFNEYFEHLDAPQIIQDPLWAKAKERAIKKLKFNESGTPVSLEQVINRGLSEDKYNTSSGFPLYRKRKTEEARQDTLEHASTCIKDRIPTTVGSRANIGHTGMDARHIFMGSMRVNAYGQRFQQPLQDYIRKIKLGFFIPWEGWEAVQAALSANYRPGCLFFGADYTKMDQHFNKYHGYECYDVIKHYFKPEYWDELHEIIDYVFTMPIITNLGYVDQEHGMPSGSEWTNFLETVWNFIFNEYLFLKYHFNFILSMGIGDDQLWLLDGKWSDYSIKWIIDCVMKEFDAAGLPGNKDKQEVSTDETGFLQRHILKDWAGLKGNTPVAGVYSLIRNVTSQVYPEFYHHEEEWDSDMFALRVIMIAENCNNHPLFEWYVKEYVAKANEHILEFVRMSDEKLHEASQRAKKIANFLPTYNQAKVEQPLFTFETVKLLREVA